MRKPISKATRIQVYNKYGGHCAYCGRELTLKDMQIDHAIAFAQSYYGLEKDRERVKKMIDDDSITPLITLCPLAGRVTSIKVVGTLISYGETSKILYLTLVENPFKYALLCNTGC